MNRRQVLKFAATGSSLLSGCARHIGTRSTTHRSHTATATSTTATPTGASSAESDLIVVGPAGDSDTPGTPDAPLKSIQTALERAQPGDTVAVRPGRYLQSFETVRSGTPENPIRLTGPPDAVVSGAGPAVNPAELGKEGNIFHIHHSHVHLEGLTFDGLHDPDRPDRLQSYRGRCIRAVPPESTYLGSNNGINRWETNLTGLKITPHAVGNVAASALNIGPVADSEIGEFSLLGPTGLEHYNVGDEPGNNGEVIYLGHSAPETTDIHIHHVDNSAGHAHTELVDAKGTTRDILVEYCTDSGGCRHACVRLGGARSTLRWSRLSDCRNVGALVGMPEDRSYPPEVSTENAVYENELLDNGTAIRLIGTARPRSSQRVICGNEYNTVTHVDGAQTCPAELPEGNGIGHTGGEHSK